MKPKPEPKHNPDFDLKRYTQLVEDKHTAVHVAWTGSMLNLDAIVRPKSPLYDGLVNKHVTLKSVPSSFVTDECPRCDAPLQVFTNPEGQVKHACCGFSIDHEAWKRFADTSARANAYDPPAAGETVARAEENTTPSEPESEKMTKEEIYALYA